MKINNKELKKAYSMLLGKKYPQAIRYLEPKVPLFLEDELFYYFLGISCFHTGDIGGAEFYLKRCLQVNHDNISSRLYLATVQLKKKDQAGSARLWLNILDIDPENKYAQKGLNKLKRIKNQLEFEDFINSNDIFKLVPSVRGINPFVTRIILSIIIASVASVSLFYFIPYMKKTENVEREHIPSLSLDNYTGSYVEFDGDFLFTMKGAEIEELFNSIVENFHSYNDNIMQMQINKLFLSNTSNEIKGKISILEQLIQKPTYHTLKTNFSFFDVVNNPLLYKKCFVLWRGRVTNISINNSNITLDFLVGYENETYLDGLIFTNIPFEVSINQALPVEILGQIDSQNGKLM